MKILVAIKQVPSRDAQLKAAADARWIAEEDLAWEINEPQPIQFLGKIGKRDSH